MISIIMPTYNRAYVIERAIHSVIAQNYSEWELLIVDDASVDNTSEIVSRFSDKRIKYIRNSENHGANYSRNRGIEASAGEYIAFLDSDNIWDSNKLEYQLCELENENQKVGAVFCRVLVIEGEREYIVPDEHFNPDTIADILIRKNVIDTNAVIIRRECFEKVGYFDENMPRIQDWEMFFRVVHVGEYQIKYMNAILNTNYIMQDSISKDAKKFINAIFYHLDKHWDILYEKGVINEYIKSAVMLSRTEDDYNLILSKIKSVKNHIEITDEEYLKLLENFEMYKDHYNKFLIVTSDVSVSEKSLLVRFMQESGYKTAGIYGLARCGEIVYKELSPYFKIVFGIDRRIEKFHDLKIYRDVTRIKEEADVIIIAMFQGSEEVSKEIRKNGKINVVSIEKIIDMASQ